MHLNILRLLETMCTKHRMILGTHTGETLEVTYNGFLPLPNAFRVTGNILTLWEKAGHYSAQGIFDLLRSKGCLYCINLITEEQYFQMKPPIIDKARYLVFDNKKYLVYGEAGPYEEELYFEVPIETISDLLVSLPIQRILQKEDLLK